MAGYIVPSESKLVVLLLGEKLSGKSSAGNIILGRQAFGINTMHSSKATAIIFGKQVTVVDTPGWLPDCPTSSRVSQELERGLFLCGVQPCVVLLVLSALSPFGLGQWKAMEAQLRRLHTPVWEKAMALFTDAGYLGDMSVQELVMRQGRSLQWLLDRCGNRYHLLTNHPRTSQSERQQLFWKIQRMTDTSGRPVQGYERLRRGIASERQESSMLKTQERIEMRLMSNGYCLQDACSTPQRQGRSAAPLSPSRAFSSHRRSPLSLVLLGRRKSGKSSVKNMILDKAQFTSDFKTPQCSVGQGVVYDTSVTVVDTPGWSLFGLANSEKVKNAISHCPSLCFKGSKVVFLLVLPIDSFKEKDRAAVEMYLSVLGGNVWGKMLVLFTFGDELGAKQLRNMSQNKDRLCSG
uniref:AIG1-type G domain-containing protein n=1 Tax=Neogobius melanostomus TaxID=47308 RepID=A0A8C6T6E6_9GOBI